MAKTKKAAIAAPPNFKTGQGPVDSELTVVGYAMGGHTIDPALPDSYAKKSTDNLSGVSRYFIKRSTAGLDVGQLANPVGPLHDDGNQRRRYDDRGKERYEYRPTNEGAFTLYLDFLRTSNQRHLRQAQRETE